jgi:ABC-type antimicrobial peptide transport system permease subunit
LGLLGAGLGVLAAFGATRAMAKLLYDVSPADPMVYTAVSLLLVVVVLAACYFPARRATKVDPMVALRTE